MPQQAIDLLKAGIEANTSEPLRTGNVLRLPDRGRLIVAGDLHGNRLNLRTILKHADLANNPDTYLILQEIVHGGPEDNHGGCLSFKLLYEAIAAKLKFPRQIHLIMGNHDTAAITGSEVMKGGREMNQAMFSAMKRIYGNMDERVILALRQFLFSQPLAAKTQTRLWISHSLPAGRFLDKFSTEMFDRELRISDIVRPNPAYLLTWGRAHSKEVLEKLAQMLDTDLFILGHQRQENGFAVVEPNALILATDHEKGCIVDLDLSRKYELDELAEAIIPVASLY